MPPMGGVKCPSRVIRVGGNQSDLPISVRSTSDSDRKLNARAYVARCHFRTHALQNNTMHRLHAYKEN
jgi:hypothetical protein